MNVVRVLKNEYRDSFLLMKLSQDISAWEGVRQAVLVMGTPSNKRILQRVGLEHEEIDVATSNDLIVALQLEAGIGKEMMLERIDARMRTVEPEGREVRAESLAQALGQAPAAKIVAISVPGEHAAPIIQEALEHDRHVFCFSDHVPIEDELALKRMAVGRNLLLMGPECGTALLDGIGFGFANAVRRGPIAVAAASGSGIQEITTLIHRAGQGVAQAIGVGGRDMRAPMHGIMTEAAVRRLGAMQGLRAIVILAKKTSSEARRRVLNAAAKTKLPLVVDFFQEEAASREHVERIFVEDTLEACAKRALDLVDCPWPFDAEAEFAGLGEGENLGLSSSRRQIRGLFTGGTLCAEAGSVLRSRGISFQSNMDNPLLNLPPGNLLLDLGAEEYTQGRAHPFIDPHLRNIELKRAFENPTLGIILADIVLGWGCHPDPASAFVSAINGAKIDRASAPLVIVSVCGTDEDPQHRERQCEILREAGILVAPTNAAAARTAARLFEHLGPKHERGK